MIASELTPKDLPRSKIDAIADVYNADPVLWCKEITKVIDKSDATINAALMAK